MKIFSKKIALAIILSTLTNIHAKANKPKTIAGFDQATIFRAAQCGNIPNLRQLLSLGFCVDTKNSRGYTPLMKAIASTEMDTTGTVKFLLNNGANPLEVSNDGTTPLELADNLHRVEIAQAVFKAIIQRPLGTIPQSLAMLIADLKFDATGRVCILELGEGPLSYFKGHDALYPKGLIWRRLWEHLAQKNLPMWYVGDATRAKREAEIIDAPSFKSLGGVFCKSLHELEASQLFKKTISGARSKKINQAGFVLLRHHSTNTAMRNYFKKTYPEIIIINDAARQFVSSKFMTNLLFENDSTLQGFRPDCRTYDKEYSPALVKAIRKDFAQHNMVVIKPLNAANGWGVIITNHEELDHELRTILLNKKALKDFSDATYSYWYNDKNEHFIVEAFIPSKPIVAKNQEFDATMRQAFIIESNAAGIEVTFIGSYWKLPAASIKSKTSLTEIHKSNIKAGKIPSAIVCDEDDLAVQLQLSLALPNIYTKMLQCLV